MQGIDCASKLDVTHVNGLKAQGITHVGRYLATDWRGLTTDEVKTISDSGLEIFSIYEEGNYQASHFNQAQGKADAQEASKRAKTLGQVDRAIYFTVDFDAAGTNLGAVLDYFSGVVEGIDPAYKVGAYGSYGVLQYLKQHSKVDYFFQTVAWSYGKVCDFAQLYQYQENVVLAGVNVDRDKVNGDPGAWSIPVETISVTMPTALGSAPTETTKKVEVKPTTETVWVDYTVKSGDTVSELAVKYNTTVASIESKNGINSKTDLIYVGQVIKVPEQKAITHSAPAQTSGLVEWVSHTIKSGEVLSDFVVHGINADEIAKKNGISNPDRIYAGETIKIPKIVRTAAQYYTVKSGDNLSKIAADHGVSLDQIEGLNPSIKGPDYIIQPGEKVRIK